MDIIDIINEELQVLKERAEGIYTIPEITAKLKVYSKLKDQDIDVLETVLLAAYEEGGDEKVIETFRHFAGIDVENISRGRYMFQRLVDPDKLKQQASDARYRASDSKYGVAPKKFAKENLNRFA